MRKFIMALACAALLSSAGAQAGDATVLGTATGAALGGLFGSAVSRGSLAGTSVGIVAGGLIGNDIGHAAETRTPSYSGAPYNVSIYSEPNPVAFGPTAPNYVAPPAFTPVYSDGTYCREYSQETIINGRPTESYGTACLQPDGTWRVVQ